MKEEEAAVKNEMNGKDLGVIFDGTTRFGEAIIIVLHNRLRPNNGYGFGLLLWFCVFSLLLYTLVLVLGHILP